MLSELGCLSMKLKCAFNSIINPEVEWNEILTAYLIPDIQYYAWAQIMST